MNINTWIPIADIPKGLEVKRIVNDFNGLTIELDNEKNENEIVTILFDFFTGIKI